jgi:predicted patatin/cPLA2 family phospholipase
MKKIALIAEGGGFRTIFTAGVLDAFIVNNFNPFSHYLGVSGGALTLSTYLLGLYKKNYNVILETAGNEKFLSLRRYMNGGNYMDLDILFKVAQKNNPFDSEKAFNLLKNRSFKIVCTNVNTGSPHYISPTTENWLDCLKASSSLPILTREPIIIDNLHLLDGGFTDPLPIDKAIGLGAEAIIIIRTRPTEYKSKGDFDRLLGSIIYRDDPVFKQITVGSYSIYTQKIQRIENLTKQGMSIIQIAPNCPLKTERTTYSVDTLNQDYRLGVDLGLEFLYHINL